MSDLASCPNGNKGYSGGCLEHSLIKVDDIGQLTGIRTAENDEIDILSEGYLCACGIVVGIRTSGEHIPLCKLETQ